MSSQTRTHSRYYWTCCGLCGGRFSDITYQWQPSSWGHSSPSRVRVTWHATHDCKKDARSHEKSIHLCTFVYVCRLLNPSYRFSVSLRYKIRRWLQMDKYMSSCTQAAISETHFGQGLGPKWLISCKLRSISRLEYEEEEKKGCFVLHHNEKQLIQ